MPFKEAILVATSYSEYKLEIVDYIRKHFKRKSWVLDVGAGCGTYADYLKGYFKNIDAVEVFEPNIINFDLKKKYKHVYNVDIREFEFVFYDLIIMGDVLEHLTVEEAKKVLDYMLPRCKEIIVAVPYLMPQGIEEDNVYEIHKQDDLTPEIMEKRYPQLKCLYQNQWCGYYIKK